MGHIEKKQRAWENQAQALCAEKYRITCMHPTKKTFVVGKRKNTDEKFYTRDEIKNLIPFLSAKNAQGYNIYVTPLSEKFHYILLDDTTRKKIEDLKYFGFSPALTQESSPGNFQAVFIVKKMPENKNEQKIANSIVQRINQKYGDKRLSGVVHPFRLAGFANRKDKYCKNGKYPFVTLHSAKNHVDEKLNRELERTRKLYEETKAAQAEAKAKIQSEQRLKEIQTYTYEDEESSFKHAKTINNKFKREYAHQKNYALEAFDDPDLSILDYRTVKALLHQNEKKEDIKQALLQCSPSILTRHTAFDDYADRTIQKAEDEIIKQKMREQQRTSKNENENEMEL